MRDDHETSDIFVGRQYTVATRLLAVADSRHQRPVVALEQRVLSGSLSRRGRGHVHRRGAVSRDGHTQPHDAVQVYQRAQSSVQLAARDTLPTAARSSQSSVLPVQHRHRIPPPGPDAAQLHTAAATRSVPAADLAGQGQPGRGRPDARDGQVG